MVHISKLIRKKLGQVLVEEGLIKNEQVQDALQRQRSSGEFLGEALINLGYVSEMDIARAIVKQFGLPYIDASKYRIALDSTKLISPDLMRQHRFIVLDQIGKTILLAVAGVLVGEVFEKIEKDLGLQVYVYVSTSGQVEAALNQHYPQNGKEK